MQEIKETKQEIRYIGTKEGDIQPFYLIGKELMRDSMLEEGYVLEEVQEFDFKSLQLMWNMFMDDSILLEEDQKENYFNLMFSGLSESETVILREVVDIYNMDRNLKAGNYKNANFKVPEDKVKKPVDKKLIKNKRKISKASKRKNR